MGIRLFASSDLARLCKVRTSLLVSGFEGIGLHFLILFVQFYLLDGFGIGYIIKDHGVHFSVSSKHRQTKRYINMLENTLLEIKQMLKSDSSVVCHGSHHNHIIHPADPLRRSLREMESEVAEYGDYGDVYGENSCHNDPDLVRETPERAHSKGNWFSNVVPRSMGLSEISRAGIRLSFNEEIDSSASVSTSSGSLHDA